MVVAKRAAGPPAPARATSAQRAKGRPPTVKDNDTDTLVDGIEGVAANGQRLDVTKKGSKSKSKKQKRGGKSRQGFGLGDFLLRLLLLWFTIYTFAVCPEDTHSERPICRALSEYRRLVLEPYVLPPIRLALSHPSVAPYVEKAKPYADRAFNTAQPVARGVIQQWNAHIVPQWNHYVSPQWRRHVVPLWYRYAAPQLLQLKAKVTPYQIRVTDEYERRVAPVVQFVTPYVQQSVVNARRLQTKLRPYVIMAAHKTYDGYQRVAPYARPAWEKVKTLVAQLLAFLADQRRQFVDPHVRKIWERVIELSSGAPKVPAPADLRSSVSSRVSRAAEDAASVASSLMSSPTHAPDINSQAPDGAVAVKSDVPTETNSVSSTLESTSPTSLSEATLHIDATQSFIASELASALGDTALTASASVSSSAAHVSSSASSVGDSAPRKAATTSELVSEAAESLLASGSGIVSSSANAVADAASTAVSHASIAVSSSVQRAVSDALPVAAASSASGAISAASSAVFSLAARASSSVESVAPASSRASDDIDLDAFAAELGLDDIDSDVSADSASSTPTPASSPPVPEVTETEEQKAKRLQETAEKRAGIEARHSKWEDEQAALIEESRRSLRRALVALRKAATAELKESAEIRAEIESFVVRAEDLLKGAEKYLQTLVKEQRTDDEKRQLLERVLNKVQDKFTDRLGETEAVLNGWYAPWLDKELAEVRKVAEAVKDHAENAQVDIGMDYAYLDDVCYQDWQRYHDLVRRSENFTAEAEAMQDGSSVSPPANPLLKELKALQAEVEDVVLGFETRLRRIRRNNARAFGEGVKQDETDTDDATVSILPIEDKGKAQTPANIDVPPVVIGRSKDEVQAALERAVQADGDATLSAKATDEPADPEAEVKSLVEEASTEQSIPSALPVPAAVSHEEL